MKRAACLISALVLLFSCKEKKEKTLFEKMDDTGIVFNNTVTDGQLENSFYFRNYYNGGGVAIGDINNDSLPDVLLTSNMGENKLFLNKGNFKFEDITARSGMHQDSMWSTGAAMVDINNDGWMDIYVCNSGHMKNGNRRNKLYINNHHNGFTDSAAAYGLDVSAYTTQVSFFDYDLDGDLDCFMINNSPIPINNLGFTNKRNLPEKDWPVADFLKGGGDHLFRNDNGHYSEVTLQAGIHGTLLSFGLGVSVGDINGDGWPDVYVANDSYERDYLYINQKNGTFKDELEECIPQNSFSSMGADICDVNNDGLPDIFTTDMLPGDEFRLKTLGAFDNIDLYNTRIKTGLYRQFMKNCLMINNGNNTFSEAANYAGVQATDWSWGALFFDADNDGLNDIYVCNGINHDVTNLDFMDFFAQEVTQNMVKSGVKQSVDSVLTHIPINPVNNVAFRNTGNLRFEDAGAKWGFTDPSFSNGAAYADLDNDGDMDLVINNENQPAFIYKNNAREQTQNHYMAFVLHGRTGNNQAIGSKIKVFKGQEIFYRELIPSRGFQSSVDYKQIIGLGKNTTVDSVLIIWPDRSYTKLADPVIDRVNYISQPAAAGPLYTEPVYAGASLLQFKDSSFDKHQEDDYIDFYYERNLPEQLSQEGPRIARADVNGDGLEDVYIGGAKDQPGQLYIQTPTGFQKKEEPVFKEFADFEDAAVLFFDADKDGDMDLFLGAGGNEFEPGARQIQHRLYKNDGKGNFTIDLQSFPNNDMNTGAAAAADFDGDGDMDLFVGGRSVPHQYGYDAKSYLYANDGQGHFTEVTAQVAPALQAPGMITAARFTDLDGDQKPELVITGEWMATRIFKYNPAKKQFEEWAKTGLEELKGWWQTVELADLNKDGLPDLILGNVGGNFYLRPDMMHPVRLWLNDFDNSGTGEQFLTRTVDKRDMPVFLKREVTDQFPGLKKGNLKHAEYAKKSVQELFGDAMIKKSKVKEFNYCSSVVAINLGHGRFNVQELPLMVQLSSVNAAAAADVNGDGFTDLVLGGNLFTFPPQFGRLDGSYGHVLLNDGKGNWIWQSPLRSGICIKGMIRDIKTILNAAGKTEILFIQNNERPLLYSIH